MTVSVSADAVARAAFLACDPARADVVSLSAVVVPAARAALIMQRARRRLRERLRVTGAADARHDAAARDAYYADADACAAAIRDAVADACDGFEPDAVPVVALPAGAIETAGILQRAGVAYVRAGSPLDCGAVWIASRHGGRAHGFKTVADAVAYASGVAPEPVSRRRRSGSIADAAAAASGAAMARADAAHTDAVARIAAMRDAIASVI